MDPAIIIVIGSAAMAGNISSAIKNASQKHYGWCGWYIFLSIGCGLLVLDAKMKIILLPQ